MIKPIVLQAINQLVPCILAVLAIMVVTEAELFRRWFLARIMLHVQVWIDAHTTAALAREALIVGRTALTTDPGGRFAHHCPGVLSGADVPVGAPQFGGELHHRGDQECRNPPCQGSGAGG
ncbi:MAG TPA: hypothetical protein VMW83_14505 [Spirochaetia bacterium]|nr:hypothetical protein [Spirochaetia bacterium]